MVTKVPTNMNEGRASFSAKRSTNQAIGTASWTALVADTALFNVGSAYNNTNGRFTAPVAGYYQLQGVVELAASATNGMTCAIRVDGATFYLGTNNQNVTGVNRKAMAAHLIYLAANSYAEFVIYQDSGGDLNAQAGSQFSGFLVHS